MRGLIREFFALVALIAGIAVAAWNYSALAIALARWIPNPISASIAAFLLLVVAVSLGILLVGRLVRSAAHLVGLGLLDRLAGACFGLARASLLGAAILMACTTFLPPQPAIANSCLAPPLLQLARTVAVLAPSDLQQRISNVIIRFHNTPR